MCCCGFSENIHHYKTIDITDNYKMTENLLKNLQKAVVTKEIFWIWSKTTASSVNNCKWSITCDKHFVNMYIFVIIHYQWRYIWNQIITTHTLVCGRCYCLVLWILKKTFPAAEWAETLDINDLNQCVPLPSALHPNSALCSGDGRGCVHGPPEKREEPKPESLNGHKAVWAVSNGS